MTTNDEFAGFVPPKKNWSKLPHDMINALHHITALSELKVVLYILRHTWGFQEFDEPKRITLDEFEKGRKYSPRMAKKEGKERMDHGTGMSRRALNEGIERAIEHGFIVRVPDNRDAGRSSHLYQLRGAEVAPHAEVASQAAEVASRSEKDTGKETKKEDSPSRSAAEPSPSTFTGGIPKQTHPSSQVKERGKKKYGGKKKPKVSKETSDVVTVPEASPPLCPKCGVPEQHWHRLSTGEEWYCHKLASGGFCESYPIETLRPVKRRQKMIIGDYGYEDRIEWVEVPSVDAAR